MRSSNNLCFPLENDGHSNWKTILSQIFIKSCKSRSRKEWNPFTIVGKRSTLLSRSRAKASLESNDAYIDPNPIDWCIDYSQQRHRNNFSRNGNCLYEEKFRIIMRYQAVKVLLESFKLPSIRITMSRHKNDNWGMSTAQIHHVEQWLITRSNKSN